MNCWIWIILLWCCCGQGGCRNHCVCDNDCDNDSRCDSRFTPNVSSCAPNNGCGCNNDMIQPRGFAGFGDNATCGCEEKDN
ncbi:MAG: hypothetical protein J6C19_07470 [Lachnospiraceae bacterium]|nr:hypothetical protein [Lachnospiraceae bacterium]MBO5145360.1 hypothetical protein [Lachnospiraceae bacterium]